MKQKDIEKWLTLLKKDTSNFLCLLNENNFYHYSLSGDIYSSDIK